MSQYYERVLIVKSQLNKQRWNTIRAHLDNDYNVANTLLRLTVSDEYCIETYIELPEFQVTP